MTTPPVRALAVLVPNGARGGVFFAGLPPVFLGGARSVVVLGNAIVVATNAIVAAWWRTVGSAM